MFIFEFVLEGYLDKVCDCIFDVVFDVFFVEELEVCVVVEIFVIINCVVIGGEVGLFDLDKFKDYMGKIDVIICVCIKDIGYE